MSFELAPFSPSLFESENHDAGGTQTSDHGHAKKHHAPTPSDINAPKLEGIVGLDEAAYSIQ